MALPSELRTSRLRLRPLRADDADLVFRRWASLAEVPRWMVWERHRSIDDAVAFLEGVRLAGESGARVDWMVEADPAGAIGTIGLQSLSSSSYEVGYVIAPSHWGRGFASEALEAVTKAALDEDDVVRIQAHCHPDNLASRRVLEKCGYELEGRLRRCRVLPNLAAEPQDLLMLSRVR